MTNVQKERTQEAIPAYCKSKGISQKELATMIGGVSDAVISNIKNGKWESIDDKVWRKVWNYVNPDVLGGLYATADFTGIKSACDSARKNKYMVGITGDTGLGKTSALQHYATRPNVFYYYVDGTVTPRIFLRDLLRTMGIPYEGPLNGMLARIAEELNTMQEPLVMLDECGKLTDKMILILHSLKDKTAANCGYVLAGMPDFKNSLIRCVNRGKTGYAEFYRRVNIWHELAGLQPGEITQVLESNGIMDKAVQREFRKLNRFGDLTNAITLHKAINN